MSTAQINLFDEIEEQAREARIREYVRNSYRLWLETSEITPVELASDPHNPNVYGELQHVCEKKIAGFKIWQNEIAIPAGGGEFWVLTPPENCEGTQIDTCPYCGANLCRGEGQRFLRKWQRGYTYYAEKSVRDYYGLDEIDAELERRCAV